MELNCSENPIISNLLDVSLNSTETVSTLAFLNSFPNYAYVIKPGTLL